MIPLTFINWLLAVLPVLSVLILMLGFKWGGSKAGAGAWFITLLLAILRFGATFEVIAFAQIKSVLLALDVLLIIWTALLLFQIANEAGAIQVISKALVSLTGDRTMQGLILGWIFVSFLQGMGGFGVPVAITAPLLVGVGFSPIQAVIMASVGHGWAVNFGSMATSFQTMIAVTNLPGEFLAPETALLLGLSSLVCGWIVAFVAGGWGGLRRTWLIVLLTAIAMGSAQYFLSTNSLWNLGATGAGMAGMMMVFFLLRLPLFKNLRRPAEEKSEHIEENPPRSLWVSISGYLVLVILAFAINLIPPLKSFLSSVRISLAFPALTTSLGWQTAAESGRIIKVFSHPGAILFYASVIAFIIYRKAGYIQQSSLKAILERVANNAVKSSLGILAMVAVAVIMQHAGMTNLLAQGLSSLFGDALFPVISPFIGALGAFITGSNNNANVLFAVLQMQTAELLGLSVPLILGAQTAGASLGSIIAPAKIIVGCSTVGLGSQEDKVIGKVLGYGLIPIVFVALITLLMAQGGS